MHPVPQFGGRHLEPRRRTGAGGPAPGRLPLHRLVPWFIVGRLTVISMAALGLGTDLRVVARAGGRVTAAATLSLLVLGGLSLGLIRLLGLA